MSKPPFVVTVRAGDRGKKIEVPESTWIRPRRRGFHFICCDCGSVHSIDFRLFRGALMLRIRRAARKQAAIRRAKPPIVRNAIRKLLAAAGR